MAQQLEPVPFDESLSPHAPRLADLLIRAGAIYSMAQHRAVYQAIAIRDEWIVAVSQGSHGLDGLISADTRVLDAPDLTILPAFEDTHNHLMFAAQNMGLVPVDRAHTLAEFIDLLRQRAVQTPPGTWIQSSAAWHEVNLVEGRLPTAPELDEATRIAAALHAVLSPEPASQTARRKPIRCRQKSWRCAVLVAAAISVAYSGICALLLPGHLSGDGKGSSC